MHDGSERVLILGAGQLARMVFEEACARPGPRFTLLGVVAESPRSISPALNGAVVGSMDELPAILDRLRPKRIVVALHERRDALPAQPLLDAKLHGIHLESGEDFYERVSGKLAIESLTPARVILDPKLRQPSLERVALRVINTMFAAAALVLLAPVLAAIAASIRIDSGSPVFFVQPRVGLQGRTFRLIKFRTMRPACGRTSEWARDNGHRITRVGRWLRRFRLDELPQLINILRGEMSLVGPRPHPTSNFEMLFTVSRNVSATGADFPYYALRTSVLPGITGWAQVRYGYANDVSQEIEKLKFDLYYVKHRSMLFDFRILFETLRVVLSGSERPIKAG